MFRIFETLINLDVDRSDADTLPQTRLALPALRAGLGIFARCWWRQSGGCIDAR